jgi:hypothetical protein
LDDGSEVPAEVVKGWANEGLAVSEKNQVLLNREIKLAEKKTLPLAVNFWITDSQLFVQGGQF